ncbi:MAG: hypothetical protein HFJ66_09825 [Eggerthellaceae bacterium]|nr:hypothetical protein [Eggerthellaceae bacterium]
MGAPFFIALGSYGTHVIIRVFPFDPKKFLSPRLTTDSFNKLISWKSIADLRDALGEAIPLIPQNIDHDSSRIISLPSFVHDSHMTSGRIYGEGYDLGSCHAQLLRAELYLDGPKGSWPSESTVNYSIERFGFVENNGLQTIETYFNEHPDGYISIEPLNDYVFARNLASISSRILANLQEDSPFRKKQCAESESLFGYCGFKEIEISQNDMGYFGSEKLYVIPLSFSPIAFLSDRHGDRREDAGCKVQPLFELLFSADNEPFIACQLKKNPFCKDNATVWRAFPHMEGSGHIVDKLPELFFHWRRRFLARNMCYLVLDGSASQTAVAQKFLKTVFAAFRTMTLLHNVDDDRPGKVKSLQYSRLGWHYTEPSLFENSNGRILFHSLASALFGTAMFREGRRMMSCKECGRAYLVEDRANPSAFCSQSCRNKHSLASKKPKQPSK